MQTSAPENSSPEASHASSHGEAYRYHHARDPQRIRHHYEIERELAQRLRNSSRAERGKLYSVVYDELFQKVPDHPQLWIKDSLERRASQALPRLAMLQRFLRPNATYLEVGAGDCTLAFAVAPHVRRVVAVDVSDAITRNGEQPANFTLALSDGISIPAPPGTVDIAMSDQLMEHLHPDDALDHLRNIYRALAPGGAYVCATPNRHFGPHDISCDFDEVSTGFHLKEYSFTELADLFRAAGFFRLGVLLGGSGRFVQVPLCVGQLAESIVTRTLSATRRRAYEGNRLLSQFAEIRMIGFR